ncbi:hypothetical protein BGZ91_001702 [Linnemannia elongata]|nr:hypothetical protein BGZ91_001702 [Linnemannia elongata]
MSSEQSELKDTPAHVEQIASYTTQDEKDQTLFHRKGSNEEFVDEKAAAHGGYDAHEESKDEKVLGLRKKLFKMLVHGFLWVCFTAFLVVSIVLNKNGPISVLAVAYGFTTLYLISAYSPADTFARPAKATWNAGAGAVGKLPLRIRQTIGYGIFPVAMILTAVIPEDDTNGTRVQRFMASFLGFSSAGNGFIIGDDMMKAYGGTFLFGVLPAIIFFGAVIQVLYYYNVIQTTIGTMGRVIVYIFEISGVEVIAACAAPFVGMSESAMLVGPYLEHATNAEIHQVLASGFATISGSVYLGLIGFGASPTHLITCCVMSVPCAIVTSKMRYPEEEVPLTRGKNVTLERPEAEESFVHALANGSILGMQLCIVISAVLVGFISLLACANYVLNWLFVFLGVTDITIERLIGYCFYPIAWILGMPSQDVFAASKMMGAKYIINEFYGFAMSQKAGFFTTGTERGKMLATFACCSFANPSSLGSQISLLGKMAPSRGGDIARVAVSAIFAGALSTIMSACIAGIVL